MAVTQTPSEYHYPLFLRIGAPFALVVSLVLAEITWLAYRNEGMTTAPYIMPLWLAMAGYWVYTMATMPGLVRFEREHLVIRYLWGAATLPYGEIDAVRFTPWGLLVRTPSQLALLSRIHPNVCAAIHGELEQRAPVAQAARQQRFAAFPIVIQARRTAPIVTGVFSVLLIAFVLFFLNYTFSPANPSPVGEKIGASIFILVLLLMGGGFLYFLLFRYVWRYTFTAATIQARTTFYTQQWDVAQMVALELKSEESTYRGAKRRRWWLELQLGDGQKIVVSPSQFANWLEDHDVGDEVLLRHLATRLSTLYGIPQRHVG